MCKVLGSDLVHHKLGMCTHVYYTLPHGHKQAHMQRACFVEMNEVVIEALDTEGVVL